MTSEDKMKQKAIIQFCFNFDKTPTQDMELMSEASGKPKVACSFVHLWHKSFSKGRETVRDDTTTG